MKTAVCLGNPGIEYEWTRHNAGFIFADKLAEKLNCSFSNSPKLKAYTAKALYNSEIIWIIKPMTYMNLSGDALALFLSYYKINKKDIIAVYDDIALNTGRIRFRSNGSSGGHNGIKSITKCIGSETFDRLKIGIGPQTPNMKSEQYVLQKFTPEEAEKIKETIDTASDAFLFYIREGIEKAQNKYN